MIKFEKVKRFADVEFDMPSRKTAHSAGYDMVVAEDVTIPTWTSQLMAMAHYIEQFPKNGVTLEELAARTKSTKAKPTLVSTGVKCYLDPGYYLELSVRSSTPLKYWIILANSVGIIDADYADNPDNEGEIFFQVINMSPFPIQLRKGDIIGQGIIKKYEVIDDDNAEGVRTGGFGSTSEINGTELIANLFNAIRKDSQDKYKKTGILDDGAGSEANDRVLKDMVFTTQDNIQEILAKDSQGTYSPFDANM